MATNRVGNLSAGTGWRQGQFHGTRFFLGTATGRSAERDPHGRDDEVAQLECLAEPQVREDAEHDEGDGFLADISSGYADATP